MPSPEEVKQNVIAVGRAYIRLIESADTLLERQPALLERLILRVVRSLYTYQLRRLVAELPPEITAEILAASEKIAAPAKGFSQN